MLQVNTQLNPVNATIVIAMAPGAGFDQYSQYLRPTRLYEAAISGQHGLATIAAVVSIVLALSVAYYMLSSPRLPDAPILKISSLPGQAGAAADIAAFVRNGRDVMQAGYERYSKHGKSFLMRTPSHTVFVAAPQFIDEIRSANDRDMSPLPANNVIMQLRYTLNAHLEVDQYHFGIVQRQLTQNLGPGLPAIVDEGRSAFAKILGRSEEWREVGMWDASFQVVTRTANRLLFGEDLAKDPDFLKLSIDYSFTMFGGADMVRAYPSWMKSLIIAWKTGIYAEKKRFMNHLGPIITERLALMEQYEKEGRMAEFNKIKANDAIQWVLDITPPEKRDVPMLVWRMIHIDISAVHTSSVTFLDCMNELAARPEIHDDLREEIRTVFEQDNGEWRKQGLTKLVKMDSFMRETVRFSPLFAGQLDRVVIRDTKLSDGTLLPKDTYVTTPSFAMYMDDKYYEDAHVFDPYRYAKKRAVPGQETLHSFVQTTPSFLHFG